MILINFGRGLKVAEGLVSGQRMAVGASLIEAGANRQYSASQ
ncbi:hypothetical protein [Parasulfitobacter algicola]|nr:hypothetical protein [Sulfitobacter algicola]